MKAALWILAMTTVSVSSLEISSTTAYGAIAMRLSPNRPAFPKVVSHFNPVQLTHRWWASFIWRQSPDHTWSQPLFAYPLSAQATSNGLGISYSPESIATLDLQTDRGVIVPDLLISVSGLNASETQVDSYSDWAVTTAWNGSDGQSLKATLGRGIPFVYLEAVGGRARLEFGESPTIWYQADNVVGFTIHGHHYGVFGPTGTSWTKQNDMLESNLGGQDYFSVSILPDNKLTTLKFFHQHAYAFVTKTTVSWSYDVDHSRVVTEYSMQTDCKELQKPGQCRPLIALFRHQWLNSDALPTEYSYASPHGIMKLVDGSRFTISLSLSGILPERPPMGRDDIDSFSRSLQERSYLRI